MGNQDTFQERCNALNRRIAGVRQVALNLHAVGDLNDMSVSALNAMAQGAEEAISLALYFRNQLNGHNLSHVSTREMENRITRAVVNLEYRMANQVHMSATQVLETNGREPRSSVRSVRELRGDADAQFGPGGEVYAKIKMDNGKPVIVDLNVCDKCGGPKSNPTMKKCWTCVDRERRQMVRAQRKQEVSK